MRGSKHGDEIRERAYALLASGESVSATAKALQLSYTTVKTWERAWAKKAVVKARQGNADECAKSSGKSENTCAETMTLSDSDINEAEDTSPGEKEKTLDELREEMKREFVRRSCQMIQDTQTLLERRIQRAVHKEDIIDELIDMVNDNAGLTVERRNKIIGKIEALRLDDIRALSSILATLWDKQALAMKEPTVNVGGSLSAKFEDFE